MAFRLTKADTLTAICIALFLPLYYKGRFLLEGLVTWSNMFSWSMWVEFLFSALLGVGVVAIHRALAPSTRFGLALSACVSAAAAALFAVFFYRIVFPWGVQTSFLYDVALLAVVCPLIISGVGERILLGERAAIAEKIALQARYEVLKSRLSPHFLFNSLSTLSDLIEEDSDLAVRFVERIATMYRYIIEHEGDASIGLDKEIEAAEALLFVLETRHPGALVVSALPPEEAMPFKTAPLAVQALLENALKHNQYSADMPMHILITIDQDELLVENTLNPGKVSVSLKTGLDTLSERLQLLTGRRLRYGSTGDRFWVRAPLLIEASV